MAYTTEISWRDGVPTSNIYGDIYFSKDSGLLETNHVFLEGNRLSERWDGIKSDFHIFETGFGTGLNFLASWKLWREKIGNCGTKLYFTSVEKHPLGKDDIYQANKIWKDLSLYNSKLVDKYKVIDDGEIVLLMDECKVELRLIFRDVNLVLNTISTRVDAWFLDGFSPAKNPDMWNENIYKNMSRLTNPGGTFATFTAVGNVRRGLQNNGFRVQKISGFGSKRHMLAGDKI